MCLAKELQTSGVHISIHRQSLGKPSKPVIRTRKIVLRDEDGGWLDRLERYGEASKLLRKLAPVARRVLGESDETTLRMRWTFGEALYKDDGATLEDLREAMTTLEETARIARRVLGGAHPLATEIEQDLEKSRAVLRARETPSTSA